MLISKYRKLIRRSLGTLCRPKRGIKGYLFKLARFLYLIFSCIPEFVGDITFRRIRMRSKEPLAPKKILIVKVDQLGDVLFSTLLPLAIRSKYPNVQIDYLVRRSAEGVLLGNPLVTSVYYWNNIMLDLLPGRGSHRKWRAKVNENRSVIRQLRAQEYDYVINARAYVPSSNLPLKKLGRRLIAFDISERSFVADYWADYSLDDDEVSNYARLLTPLDIEASGVQYAKGFYNVDASPPIDPRIRYAVISPVSFEPDRQWGENNWRQLICSFSAGGITVILAGLPSHRAVLDTLIPAELRESTSVKVLVDLPLAKFAALIRNAACFAGIDSFPAHLAIALGCRAALFVNTKDYYLKGYSRPRFASEARSMLPKAAHSAVFDTQSTGPEEVFQFCAGDQPTDAAPVPERRVRGEFNSDNTAFL
jgi:ADP-heptose:LPS heptosyltransferase